MIFSFSESFLVIIMLSLSMASFLIDTSSGFVSPLIHITSPEHPLYDLNRTRADIVRHNIHVSNERIRYFAEKRRNFRNYKGGVAPISYNMIMKYYIGTPPVLAYAVPDTGSDVNWLQCQPCRYCYHQEAPIFDPSKSSTYQLALCASRYCKYEFRFHCGSLFIGCEFKLGYMDTSTTEGVVATETIMLPGEKYSTTPNLTVSNIVVGCGFYNKDPTGGVGGVIGLQNSIISLPGQMEVQAFSYCISDGGDGGYIRFGSSAILMGYKLSLSTNKYREYRSIMLDIVVGGTRLNLSSDIFKEVVGDPDTGVMIDTGAPLTRLNPEAFNSTVAKIKDIMTRHVSYKVPPYYEVCYNAIDDDTSVAHLPSVHFVLENNVMLKIPNENIWSEEDNDGNLCLKMFDSGSNMTVIGSELLKSYNVGFDLGEGKLWLDYQEDCRY